MFSILLLVSHVLARESTVNRQLNIFSVVQFPNDECESTIPNMNGTCYPSDDCRELGGTPAGTCASSFGTCCVFQFTCGGETSQNSSVFSSKDVKSGSACDLKVCRTSDNICQYRLDFDLFELTSPVTDTMVTSATANNSPRNSVGQCHTDQFMVSNPCGGGGLPTLCGKNSGQHMYIPACQACTTLQANIGLNSTVISSSGFRIKISQIECNSFTLPPLGCLQYFTEPVGVIESFNYNSGAGPHLADQDYSICIRSPIGTCSICYAAAKFRLTANQDPSSTEPSTYFGSSCGGPSNPASVQDYLMIPEGQCSDSAVPTDRIATVDRYCGQRLRCPQKNESGGLEESSNGMVCSSQKPFRLRFHTDSYEGAEANGDGTSTDLSVGFRLVYTTLERCLTRS